MKPIRICSDRPQAFTIIEVLAVVLIVALILGAGGNVIFKTISSTRLTTAGQGLQANISLARQLAVSRNVSIAIVTLKYLEAMRPFVHLP
jgi:prepilin-type N-terminal cleavage/methylation domain-containing protein